MNEELQIIIKAVTDSAKKNIQGVKKELGGMGKEGGKSSASLGKAFKAVGVAAVAVVGAIVAIGTALVSLANNTKQFRQEQSKLNTAFLAAGSTTEQAAKSYSNLYRFLGDSGKATEAGAHLAKLTTDEKHLAEWTTALQGVYATFGDSLPIEGLTEAANETAKVGKVTGTLADALNWAGVNEDAFNAQLAKTNSESEREALIRNTLNGLYSNAAQIYEKNNAELIAANEAQARLDATTANLGKTVQPLQTALTNLSAVLLQALAPAIEVVTKALTWLINAISTAVSWIVKFFGITSGKDTGIGSVATGFGNAATGAGAITNNLNDATKAAEKLKRTTAGFDELNVISSGSSSSGSGSAAGGGSTGGIGAGGGFALDTSGITGALDSTGSKFDEFSKKVKDTFNELKTKVTEYAQLFAPSFDAWKEGFSGMGAPLSEAVTSIGGSLTTLWNESLAPFGSYVLEDFVPNITNSFNENFAPIFTDIMKNAFEQFPKDFEWACLQIGLITEEILKPAMESVETITTDTFDAVGNEWEESGDSLITNFNGVVESFKGIWDNLYNNVIKPVWDKIVGGINSLWKEHLEPLWKELLSFFSKLGECIMTVWNNFLAPILNWLITVLAPLVVGVVDSIMDVINTIVGVIAGVVKGILKALGGLLDFITGIFSGDWNKAWQGIKDFFGGIWDAIWSIAKGIINSIIDGINLLWTGIYNAIRGIVNGIGSIAGAIGDLFGKDWHFSMPKEPPKIPKLAKGGIVNSATLAMIGERGKEAVVPLENNTEWMDKLADRLAARMNTPSKIVLMLNETELGWANINSINGITQQTGSLQLRMV